LPIGSEIVDRARYLIDVHRSLSARDAVHAAVVLENGLDGICSFDRDFDRFSEIVRVEPGLE
jgi:predicted nucleic acid-binding protein